MIYKNKFNLTGTTAQQNLVKEALDKIYFPWETLNFPNEPVEIGWMDLNGRGLFEDGPLHKEAYKAHEGKHGPKKEGEDVPDYLTGNIEERNYVLGVFYTGSGRIYIDNLLVQYPELARATVSAEIAHAVDYFLPLTDLQKNKIILLMHNGDSAEHGHSWWEKADYGAEYYDLVGESFMQAFTVAYSDIPFGNAEDFTHSIRDDQADALRAIVGIERTDTPITTTTSTTQAPATTTSTTETTTLAPTTTETTTVESTTSTTTTGEVVQYEVFGKSNVYHRLSHYDKPHRIGQIITDTTGRRPCKVCKP